MYHLFRSDKTAGASGENSWRINLEKEDNTYTNQHPVVGAAILVGNPSTENWWRTNLITEIIEEETIDNGEVVKSVFLTASGSIYTWLNEEYRPIVFDLFPNPEEE